MVFVVCAGCGDSASEDGGDASSEASETRSTTSTASTPDPGTTSDTSTVTSSDEVTAGSSTTSSSGDDPPASEASSSGPDGDALVADVEVEVHDEVNTILVVTWEQTRASEETWIEFGFDEDVWLRSPARPGTVGAHREVLLGIPGDTEVTFRIVNVDAGTEVRSSDHHGVTDEIPSAMPRPTVEHYDPTIASAHRWMFGAVEDTESSRGTPLYYEGPHWLYIVDRQGRIVWYYVDLAVNPTSAFPRITPDGHIYIEKRQFSNSSFAPSVLHMTLDHAYEEEIDVPGLDDCTDVTDDGTLLYNTFSSSRQGAALMEMAPDGTTREIWSCAEWVLDHGVQGQNVCYSNTVNWNRADDTVLMSMPYINTVVEIDRMSGALVGQYGDAPDSWPLTGPSYDDWTLEFNHFANVTPEGTLLVSSHEPGHGGASANSGSATETFGTHMFLEFDIDRDNQQLVERWFYTAENGEWPRYKGMVMRVDDGGGNVLANFGTGGVILEITPDKEVAFRLVWDGDFTDDRNGKMAGHNILIDDLYALNRVPE